MWARRSASDGAGRPPSCLEPAAEDHRGLLDVGDGGGREPLPRLEVDGADDPAVDAHRHAHLGAQAGGRRDERRVLRDVLQERRDARC